MLKLETESAKFLRGSLESESVGFCRLATIVDKIAYAKVAVRVFDGKLKKLLLV